MPFSTFSQEKPANTTTLSLPFKPKQNTVKRWEKLEITRQKKRNNRTTFYCFSCMGAGGVRYWIKFHIYEKYTHFPTFSMKNFFVPTTNRPKRNNSNTEQTLIWGIFFAFLWKKKIKIKMQKSNNNSDRKIRVEFKSTKCLAEPTEQSIFSDIFKVFQVFAQIPFE